MHIDNKAIAVAYYTAMKEKNVAGCEVLLHEDVQFVGPLATMIGKPAVVSAIKNFAAILKDINIRAAFGTEDQAMLAYDMVFPEPIGNLRAATLMNIKDGLIVKLELFYDARPFEKKREEIFS